jgi:hypothetical protein
MVEALEMSEDVLEKRQQRAAHAKRLIDDELLKEAFEGIRAAYFERWLATNESDSVLRENLWRAMNVTERVKAHLARVIDDGKIAARDIADLADRRKRFGVF